MLSHSDTYSCLSGTEVHKFHHFDRATSSKETKTEKINTSFIKTSKTNFDDVSIYDLKMACKEKKKEIKS